ncbi:MAG: ABC transporter permease [Rhodospirillaceae bacterium]|nr:ABC transporter permease [Rhodospirillaceae bacterium]
MESLTRKVRPPRSAKWVALFSAMSPIVLLLIWEALSRLGWIDRHFFPAPSAVLTFLWADLAGGQLLVDIGATLRRVLVGFAMGGIPAVILGLLLGMSRPLRMFLAPIFATLFSVPKIAILPLILFVFGLGDMSKFVLIAIGAFFPIFFNTLGGVLQAPAIYFDVARSVGASRWERFFSVALPAALPSIFTGLRLAAGISFVLIAAAEFVGSRNGVGYYIWSSWEVYSIYKMFAGVITISVMGYLSIVLINRLERLWVPYQTHTITE